MQITIDTSRASGSELQEAAELLLRLVSLASPWTPATPQPQFAPGEAIPAVLTFAANGMTAPEAPPPPFVPAPPATASTPPDAGPTATSGASPSDLDRAGLPWDARIHSEARKLNADGTWRLRRNLAEDVKTAVTAELRMQHPVSLPPPPAAMVPPPPPPVTLPPVGAAAPAVPAGVPAGPVSDFKGLMAKAGALMQSGKLTHPQLAQACVACGVASLPALMQAPEKIPAVNAWLDENIPR